MRTKIVVLVLVAAMVSRVTAQQVDKEQLREVVKVPMISLFVGFKFDPVRGFILLEKEPDAKAEIAALQKAMRGDVSDAERYYRLGELYQDHARAQAAFAKSVDLYRKMVKAQSHNGRLLAQCGDALWAARKDEEAESVLRQAVKVAPQEWKCWTALGQFLGSKSLSALLNTNTKITVTVTDEAEFGKLLAQVLQNKPSSEQIARAQKWLDEAHECYNKAVAAAPQEAQTYALRGTFRAFSRGLVRGIIGTLRGEKTNLMADMLSPDALPDFRQAARLSPHDYRAIVVVALFEFLSFIVHSGQEVGFGEEGMWEALPEQTRQSVRAAIDRLEQLSQSKDIPTAAGAAEALSLLQLLGGDFERAEASVLRATALDPSREQAWETLATFMFIKERYDNIVALCQGRLKHKDSARYRLILAKAYEELDQLDKAEEQAQAALRLEPSDFAANLALAVLLLKRSDDAAVLSRAGELIAKAGQVWGKPPSADSQWMNYAVTRGVYLALTANLEEAEKQLKQVLEYDKDNEDAKEALKVIGKSR